MRAAARVDSFAATLSKVEGRGGLPSAQRQTGMRSRPLSLLEALFWGAAAGAVFAAGFVVSGLIGIPASSEVYVGLSVVLAVTLSLLVLVARALVDVRGRLELQSSEIRVLSDRVSALQSESNMLREVTKAVTRLGDKRPTIDTGVKFGTLGGRSCALLGDGSMIVATLVGYRRFNNQQDAEAFVGESGLSLAEAP